MQETTVRKRSIRSFVRRSGRLTHSQQAALRELWPVFGIDYSEAPLNLNRIFGRTAPVILEIGFGNGETLVQQAACHPDRDYIGVEVHEPGIGHCLLRARDTGLRNLRVISHDAIDVLTHQIPLASLSRVNLYFPDPWPKKRHHKRRILQTEFLNLIFGRLADTGTLHIATDWSNYAEHIDELFDRSQQFACRERREHDGDRPLDRPTTKFEARGLRKGHRICDWCFVKSKP